MLGFENRKFRDTYIFGKYVRVIFFVNILQDKVPPLFAKEFFFIFCFLIFLTSFVNTGYKYKTGLKIANDAFTNETNFFLFCDFLLLTLQLEPLSFRRTGN